MDDYVCCGEHFPGVDTCLKVPYTIDAMGRQWRDAYAREGIHCSHTLHLCREEQSVVNSLNGYVSLSERCLSFV